MVLDSWGGDVGICRDSGLGTWRGSECMVTIAAVWGLVVCGNATGIRVCLASASGNFAYKCLVTIGMESGVQYER